MNLLRSDYIITKDPKTGVYTAFMKHFPGVYAKSSDRKELKNKLWEAFMYFIKREMKEKSNK